MTTTRSTCLLRTACVASLAALALIVWAILDPRPIPVVAAMSIGQTIGTLAFAVYLFVVVADVRAQLAARGGAPSPPQDLPER